MKLKLVDKKEEATKTVSFFWEPENEVQFLPGQYFYYTLPLLKYPDDRGPTRHFTIASSPTEKTLMLTTRIRETSGYKKTINEFKVGDTVEGEGPAGTFIFDEKSTKTQVFIAGGIGITPFRSFIKYAYDKNLKVPLRLIFSNSDSEFVYKQELDEWANKIDLKIDYIDTSKTGHLNKTLILKSLKNWGLDIKDTVIWVVGPPPFINAIEDEVEKLNISSDSVRTEKFSGY